ncbi:hypothetical protein AO1008_08320 [Aspergillus oryzae 100-8]|uniref:Sushi domain-containing protein n=1 Tax=Aspergillus oryzae (strain 3.042) TaxID=1160506 RepID=I8ICX0_ASPO3|nr:hypothetical protein Ao3042_08449 [Aspergillus oryzae 3.042]KDE82032.1 hypothetical protein AO1008_08320 [Aspergillus oryzae 100-8]|eukprot:EIT75596.1 hypothetical protein Ao3042_08449 [Aspergillus oryzae 3.042]
MKSPIYLLTALLPLTLPLVNATPTAEPDDLEVEGSVLEDRDNCRVERPFVYRKYPCDSSDITGRANRGDNVNFQCRYRNWYKTPKGWVKQDDKPRRCLILIFNGFVDLFIYDIFSE